MNLPRRRRSRPRGAARLAAVPARDDTQPAAWHFEGASDIGVMPEGVVAIKDWGRDTQPLAWLRDQPETRADA